MRRTLYSHALARVAVPTAVLDNDTAVNGSTIDLGDQDYRSVLFVVLAGTVTDGTHAVTVQDSPNGSDWTAVAAEYLQGALPTLDDGDSDSVHEIGYIPNGKRYVRCVITSADTTTGGVIGAIALCAEGANAPVVRA